MRILYLCHRIPYPPDKGDKIRAFHQLRALGRRHEVDLFGLADDPADLAGVGALQEYCRRVVIVPLNSRWARLRSLPFLLTRSPLTIPYFSSAALGRQVRRAMEQRAYHRIVVYCSAMAPYVDLGGPIPVFTDLVDVDSNKWAQYAAFARFPLAAVYRREAAALRRYERKICEKSSYVFVTTDREARLVREISPDSRVEVIPNGVDAEYFKPASGPSPAGPPVIGFTGDMGYFPNQEAVTYFVREVLPLIRRRVPAAGFLIVGRNPGPAVRRLGAISGVEVTGFVPDVRRHLARMQVAVAPFRIAAGIQNKVLEAMAYQVPVVASARAAQGLTPAAAAAIEIADGAPEMAAKILDLLGNPELAHRQGAEARRRVTAEYDWERSLERWLEIIENPAGSGRQTAAVSQASGPRWNSNCSHADT